MIGLTRFQRFPSLANKEYFRRGRFCVLLYSSWCQKWPLCMVPTWLTTTYTVIFQHLVGESAPNELRTGATYNHAATVPVLLNGIRVAMVAVWPVTFVATFTDTACNFWHVFHVLPLEISYFEWSALSKRSNCSRSSRSMSRYFYACIFLPPLARKSAMDNSHSESIGPPSAGRQSCCIHNSPSSNKIVVYVSLSISHSCLDFPTP